MNTTQGGHKTISIMNTFVSTEPTTKPTKPTEPTDEGFALLEKSDDINFKKKYKNSGHESYKSATLMDNLESYLLNMIKI